MSDMDGPETVAIQFHFVLVGCPYSRPKPERVLWHNSPEEGEEW